MTAFGTAAIVALSLLASAASARSTDSQALSIVTIKVTPEGVLLMPTKLNVVTASARLGFKVAIRNGGESRKEHVRVKLAISWATPYGSPSSKAVTVDAIGPHQTKTVTFTQFGPLPFAVRTKLTIALETGSAKVYPVIFALP